MQRFSPQKVSHLFVSVLYSAESKRMRQLIDLINKSLLIASVIIFLISCIALWSNAIQITVVNTGLYLALHFYLRTGYIRSAGLLTIFTLWLSVTYCMYTGDGVHDISVIVFPIVLIIGSLLLNTLYFALLMCLCALSLIVVGHLDLSGELVNKYSHHLQTADIYTTVVLILLSGILIRFMTEFTIVTLERVNARERQNSEILNSLHDAVFILELETGRIIGVNETMLRMYGYKREEALLVSITDISSDDPEYSMEHVQQYLQTAIEEGSADFRWRAMQKDGTRFWVQVVLTPMEVDGVKRVVAVVRDVDSRLRLEEQLKQAEKLTAIGQLAGGIAHDFNNMLAGILGAAEVMGLKDREGDDQRMLDLIVSSTHRAADLTGKLLTFSKKREMHLVAIDLHDVIKEADALLTRSIDKRVVLQQKLQAEQARILGDRTQLLNVFLNLGINASDAMGGDGQLVFHTKNVTLSAGYCKKSAFDLQPGAYIELRVEDSGSGIPDEIKSQIFDPFFSTKDKNENTGLGLAAAYGIIKDHGGEIAVHSEPGRTEFVIHLQLTDKVDTDRVYSTVPVTGSGTILLVDDEPNILFSVDAMLSKLGYTVLTAVDGRDALRVYKERRAEIDLIILDMIMPELNGRECFYELQHINPEVRVLLSSGFTEDISIKALLKDGACGFVSKPYRMTTIAKLMEKHLK